MPLAASFAKLKIPAVHCPNPRCGAVQHRLTLVGGQLVAYCEAKLPGPGGHHERCGTHFYVAPPAIRGHEPYVAELTPEEAMQLVELALGSRDDDERALEAANLGPVVFRLYMEMVRAIRAGGGKKALDAFRALREELARTETLPVHS